MGEPATAADWLEDDPRAWRLFPAVTAGLAAGWVFVAPRLGLPEPLPTATGFVYLALIAVATATDAAWHRVYNWTTYPAAALALALAGAASVLPAGAAAVLAPHGVGGALGGFAACFAVMFVLQGLFTGGGAGDLKLAAAIGTALGWSIGLQTILYGFILAGVGAVVLVAWRLTGPAPTPGASRFGGAMPLGPFLAAGSVAAVVLSAP